MAYAAAAHGGWILVVDEDVSSLALVSSLLVRVGFETREARSGTEALAAVNDARPALVILEVELAGVSGYEVCRELRDRFGQELPIVFMSATRVEAHDRAAGILLGADDYIVKPFDHDELLARLRRLAARGARRAATRYTLTLRELEVLRLLSAGLVQDEIAKRLFISSKTVATHIQRILEKLGVRSRAQAVALAHREHLLRPDTAGPPPPH